MEKKRLTSEERRARKESALKRYEEYFSKFSDEEFADQFRAYGMEVEFGEGRITFVEADELSTSGNEPRPITLKWQGHLRYQQKPRLKGHTQAVKNVDRTMSGKAFFLVGHVDRPTYSDERKG
ncbi:MAG TPA: hypothetical protein VFV52_15680 [Bacilli bacterium]|nr:hypothetical protein [Bacilli bacterium]